MSVEIATGIPEEAAERRFRTRRAKVRAVRVLGPLTMLGGVVWAVAQPYRITFFHPAGAGVYDYLAQPPLLVVFVGLLFTLLVAPGLVEDLEQGGRGS